MNSRGVFNLFRLKYVVILIYVIIATFITVDFSTWLSTCPTVSCLPGHPLPKRWRPPFQGSENPQPLFFEDRHSRAAGANDFFWATFGGMEMEWVSINGSMVNDLLIEVFMYFSSVMWCTLHNLLAEHFELFEK